MPLLRKPILIPTEGLDYSKPSTFINDRAGFPKNIRFYRNELRKRPGKTKYGTVAISGGQIMGLGKLELNNGSTFLVRTSKTKIEKYNTGTSAWDSISIVDFSGGNDDLFFFTNASENGLLIITNGVNVIRKWTGSGNTAALGGSPPKAKYCTYLSPYLLLAHIDDGISVNPWKVQWPGTGNPETWSGGNSGSLLAADEPSPIRNILKLNEWAALYKRDSLWLIRKVDTSDIFLGECIKTGIGLAASRAVVDVDGYHYFMAQNDFYVWNGIREESTGGPVRDEVFTKLDRSKITRCFAHHVRELGEVWFFIVVTGNNWPTEIWKYNYRTGFWYYDTCTELTAIIAWQKTSTEIWDNDSGTWDDALDTWDEGITIGEWEEVIFGNVNGHTLNLDYTTTNDDGTAVAGEYQTIDFTADALEYNKRWLQLDVWAKGPGTLKMYYSTDYGDTWTYVTSLSLTDKYAKYETYFDVVSDKIRFKLLEETSGKIFYIRNIYPYYLGEAEVKS